MEPFPKDVAKERTIGFSATHETIQDPTPIHSQHIAVLLGIVTTHRIQNKVDAILCWQARFRPCLGMAT